MLVPPPIHPGLRTRPVQQKYTQKVEADPSIPPNQTVYIKNLNDRINIKILRAELKELFSRFGNIIDLVALTSFWRKGQAFIVYDSIEAATQALHAMQGYMLHGHAMRLNYAKEKSDIVTKADGTFQPRETGPKKPRAIKEREETQKRIFEKLKSDYLAGKLEGMNQPGDPKLIQALEAAQARMSDMTLIQTQSADARAKVTPGAAPASSNRGLPNRILFVEGLPEGVGLAEVHSVFSSSPGYIEARVIAVRKVAFIDFDNELNAGYAMQALQGHLIKGEAINISYAKR